MRDMLISLKDLGEKNFKKFIKFGVVGLIGTFINFCVYYYAYFRFKLPLNLSAVVAFVFAVTNNYLLNHIWTFRSDISDSPISIKRFLLYVLVNLKGLGINLLVLNAIVFFLGIKFNVLGQMTGIALGMLSNFLYAKGVVFAKSSSNQSV